jgi:hypothetical protein
MNIFLHASDQRMGVCIHDVMFVYFVVTAAVVVGVVVSFLYFLMIIFSHLKDEF